MTLSSSAKQILIIFTATLLISIKLCAQSSYLPLDKDYYHLVDRYYLKHHDEKDVPPLFTSFKPYERVEVAKIIDRLAINTNPKDTFNFNFLRNDNWEFTKTKPGIVSEKPLFKHLYKTKADLYHINREELVLRVSPILHFSGGRQQWSTNNTIFQNTRGLRLHGSIDNKVHFFTSITENQLALPAHGYQYTVDRIAVPNFGFWKRYNDTGVDFLDAIGHISFQATKHIGIQFGQDKNFIGNGIRSFILSDFTSNYPFLKLKTKIWKIQYTNLFSQLISNANGDIQGSYGTARYPKKFMALHHLSINVSKKLNIGVFESLITRESNDSTSIFELSYLNPLIFYRSVEQQSGSPDNAILGTEFRWSLSKNFVFYGQFVLDELIVSKLFGGDGAWENKFAAQLGFHNFDFLKVNTLDINAEVNIARPYLYTHNTSANYSHFNQPLAHPFGANFKEVIGAINYQIAPKLRSYLNVMFVDQGQDNEDDNFGSNIFKSNRLVAMERPFGNTIGQGLRVTTSQVHGRLSYMLKHNLHIDLEATNRRSTGSIETSNFWVSFGVRLNNALIQYQY